MMVAVGIAQLNICQAFRISEKTLRKHCRAEIAGGAVDANLAVGRSMYAMATKGPYSVRFSAAKYWLAARAGWRDVDKTVLTPMAAYVMTNDQIEDVISRQEAFERERERAAAGRSGGTRRVAVGPPGRDAVRCAEGPRNADHR